MNEVYFACTECREIVDAGYRWAYWSLEVPGVVERSQPVSVDAVFGASEYWNSTEEPTPRWLMEDVLPRVRSFLERHRAHAIVYGDVEQILGGDLDQLMDWLDVSHLPECTPRYFVEVLHLRSWDEVTAWLNRANPTPWWWHDPELRDSARRKFDALVSDAAQRTVAIEGGPSSRAAPSGAVVLARDFCHEGTAASSRSFDGYPRELTAAEVSPKLAALVRALAVRLLDGPSEEHRTLLRQLAAARIEQVRLTGVGLFAYFVHPPDAPSVSPAEMIGGEVRMRLPALDAPAGSLVVIHEGKLAVVEIYTYGQLPWPDEPRDVSFEEATPLMIPSRGD